MLAAQQIESGVSSGANNSFFRRNRLVKIATPSSQQFRTPPPFINDYRPLAPTDPTHYLRSDYVINQEVFKRRAVLETIDTKPMPFQNGMGNSTGLKVILEQNESAIVGEGKIDPNGYDSGILIPGVDHTDSAFETNDPIPLGDSGLSERILTHTHNKRSVQIRVREKSQPMFHTRPISRIMIRKHHMRTFAYLLEKVWKHFWPSGKQDFKKNTYAINWDNPQTGEVAKVPGLIFRHTLAEDLKAEGNVKPIEW